jgi:hypothetical protein
MRSDFEPVSSDMDVPGAVTILNAVKLP